MAIPDKSITYILIPVVMVMVWVLSSSITHAQLDTVKIHDLRGTVDTNNTTHLFYRLYQVEPPHVYPRESNNSIYHFSTATNKDSLFLADVTSYGIGGNVITAYDFALMGNRIKYLFYSGYGGLPDHSWYIKYRSDYIAGGYGSVGHNIVTDPATNELYLNNKGRIYRDKNNQWRIDSTNIGSSNVSFSLLSISPNQDSLLFGVKDGELTRSDWQNDKMVSNTNWSWSRQTEFYYGKDSSVVYARDYEISDYQKVDAAVVYRSTEKGKDGTWQQIQKDSGFIAFDVNKWENEIYMGRDTTLLISTNQGLDFNTVHQFDEGITGIYKPGTSDKVLYVSTISDIWKFVDGNKVTSVKHVATDISERSVNYPSEFKLEDNYPNPFNPSTNIRFALPEATDVQLTVYNSIGQEVETLVNQSMNAGLHSITFNAEGLSSGVYIYQLKANGFSQSRKMLLMK